MQLQTSRTWAADLSETLFSYFWAAARKNRTESFKVPIFPIFAQIPVFHMLFVGLFLGQILFSLWTFWQTCVRKNTLLFLNSRVSEEIAGVCTKKYMFLYIFKIFFYLAYLLLLFFLPHKILLFFLLVEILLLLLLLLLLLSLEFLLFLVLGKIYFFLLLGQKTFYFFAFFQLSSCKNSYFFF